MSQQRLTDRVIAPYITGDTLIHIVNTGDTIQYSGGSSYKATIDQVGTYISQVYNTFTTGATFNGSIIEFDRNNLTNAYSVDISSVNTDNYTTGGTYNSITEEIDFVGTNGSTTFSVDVSALLDDTNTYVTGGTFSLGTLTLERNDGNSVIVTGFTSSNYYTTGATLSGNTIVFDRNDLSNAYSVDISPVLLDYLPLNVTGVTVVSIDDSVDLFFTGQSLSQFYNYVEHDTDRKTGQYVGAGGAYLFAIDEGSNDGYYLESSYADGTSMRYVNNSIIEYYFEVVNNGLYTGGITSFSGIMYDNDYSVNYTNRSLVDKEYVDNLVSGITDNNFYTTGATLSGSTIVFDRNDLSNAYSVNLSGLTTDTNFANTNLTLIGSRTHTIPSGDTLYVGQSSYVGPYLYLGGTGSGFSNDYTLLGYSNNYIDADSNHINTIFNLVNRFSILSTQTVINETGGNYDFRVEGDTDQNLFFIDASTDNVGIGTNSPSEKLDVSGKTKTINFQMTSGATDGYVLTSDASGNASWGELSSLYTGNTSGDCITDLYVSNIHSCSPLNINPLDEGNVYFGSTSAVTIDLTNTNLGVGTAEPEYKLDILGTTGRFFTNIDSDNVQQITLSAQTTSGLTQLNVASPNAGSLLMGIRGVDQTLNPGFGKAGDSFIYSSAVNNGLNIISHAGSGTDDYIRFYAGQLATTGNTPDLYIQGSGSTRGYVGINNDNPTYRLDILGTTGRVFYDGDTTRNTYRQSQIINEGPSTGITTISVASEGSGNQIELFSIGSGVSNSILWRFAGEPGDVTLYASSAANNLNIMNNLGSGTTDNIRFYVGGSGHITGQTPAMIIIGSGTTKGYVGIGTTSPIAKLHVSGTSYFDTTGLTTSTIPSFRLLDGVSTPTDTTNIKSFYKEFRPTTTSSNTVVTDGTIIYPNINSSTSAEFYASANLTFFTDDLSDLSSNEALTGEVNLVSIYTNTGTYNGIVKSSSAVLENAIAGGTIDKYVGFWANGLNLDITHNGTTNNIYGFYMDNQSSRSGNVPPTTNRYGVYIEDVGRNYFAGTVGIGTNAPSEKLDVSGKTKTINFQMTSGATNGYVLTSDASGNASWQASTGGVSINPYYVEPSTTTITWNVSGNSTNYQTVLTANTTLNLSNVRNGDYGTIIVQQDVVGSRTITFGNVNGSVTTHRVANGGGGSPILTSNASAIDILTFTYNGSTMFWTVGNDYT